MAVGADEAKVESAMKGTDGGGRRDDLLHGRDAVAPLLEVPVEVTRRAQDLSRHL